MSEEHFLARWSRRKREVAEAERAESAKEDTLAKADDAAPEETEQDVAQPAPPDATPAAFDPASLPPVESITRETDISGFLKSDVPAALTRAALRRAWASDPAIRDFVGLQENDFDFNNPSSIPGFGEIGSEHDLRQMVVNVFGDAPEETQTAAPEPAQPVRAATDSDAAPAGEAAAGGTSEASIAADAGEAEAGDVQRSIDVASHKDDVEDASDAPRKKRTHGGALPNL